MERWDRVGRGAAYGAALAMAPYFVIKIFWVAGSLFGVTAVGEGYSKAGWVLLNAVTIVMAGVGILLGLALVRPWGMGLPARPLVCFAWIGSGFLVSILPYVVLSTLLGASGETVEDEVASMPGWMAALLQFSFLGMGLGLAVALPAYLRRRWPDAFVSGDRPRTGALWPVWAAIGVGICWMYWTFGGTLGLAHPEERFLDGYLLNGLSGLWAIGGAAALWPLARGRSTRVPHQILLVIAWLGSGSLFAWSGWKLPLTIVVALDHPGGIVPPEHPVVAVTLHAVAVLAGAGMVHTLISLSRHAPARPSEPLGAPPVAGHLPPGDEERTHC